MGIFGKLFKKSVIELDDPVFGHITYEQEIWTHIPKPPTIGYMIVIDAPASGPTALQRDFFQQLRASLAEFEELARDFMRSRVDTDVDVSQLSIYAVEIGREDECRRESFVLELSDPKAIVIHRVSFSDERAVEYGCDD